MNASISVSFFEEFPSHDVLKKIKSIKKPFKLFLASRSVGEFYYWKSVALKFNQHVECIYWPVLSRWAGYWVSKYTNYSSLEKLLVELEKSIKTDKHLKIMLDIEEPFLSPWLFVTSLPTKHKSARLIASFIKSNKQILYVCVPYSKLETAKPNDENLYSEMIKKRNLIVMVYTSLWLMPKHKKMEKFGRLCKTYSQNTIAIGCIAKGILKTEPLLKLDELKAELKIASQCGVKEVVIYRLAGLNKKIVRIINKLPYSSSTVS